jgi:hypothetical protein
MFPLYSGLGLVLVVVQFSQKKTIWASATVALYFHWEQSSLYRRQYTGKGPGDGLQILAKQKRYIRPFSMKLSGNRFDRDHYRRIDIYPLYMVSRLPVLSV